MGFRRMRGGLRSVIAWSAVGVWLLLAGSPAGADQLAFSKRDVGGQRLFSYRLADRHGRQVQLGFRLDASTVNAALTAVPRHDSPDLQAEIDAAFEREVARQNELERRAFDRLVGSFRQRLPAGFSFDAGFEHGRYQWSLRPPASIPGSRLREVERQRDDLMADFRGRFTRLMDRLRDGRQDEIRRVHRDASRRIYQRHYHALVLDRHGREIVRPDYANLAHDFAGSLRPVAAALRSAAPEQTDRALLDVALQFYQSIPYDELRSRYYADGGGILAPPALFDANRGDCDTKTTALAATLRSLLPHRATVMLLLPGHALLGIDLTPRPGDRIYRWQGRSYVLLEPAGPGLFEIGQIAEDSVRLLDDPGTTVLAFSGT